MPAPLVPIVLGVAALFALSRSKPSSSSLPVKLVGDFSAPDNIAQVPHPLDALRNNSREPRAKERVREVSVKPVTTAPRYSPAWYKAWASWMGVSAKFPSQWEHYPDHTPIRYGFDTPGFSLRDTALGRIAWLGKGSRGHEGEPRAFAEQFVAAGNKIGPSPEVGGTKKVWGPWQGLSVKGALKAEALNYWPIDYDPAKDDVPLTNGKTCKRHETVADLIDALAELVKIIPFVGSTLSTLVAIGADAERGEPISFSDVSDIASSANSDFTGLAGKVPPKSKEQADAEKQQNAAIAQGSKDNAADTLKTG